MFIQLYIDYYNQFVVRIYSYLVVELCVKLESVA